jgi:hypothetical protein
MFDLERSTKNLLVIADSRSGESLGLYYRTPTPQEEVAYRSKVFSRKGKKLLINVKLKARFALDILTGLREGDWGYQGKAISSESTSPDYREDWKDLLNETAQHILIVLAEAIFEGTRVDASDKVDMEALVVEEDEDIPFAKSSSE